MSEVMLTWPEVLLAANAGVMRRINAVRNGRQEPYGQRPQSFWTHDINGAVAEVALAKHLDLFWSGTVGRVDLPDVGPLQVRSKNDPKERLVILPTDGDGQIFVSVLVGLPKCTLCGWMRAGEAKRPEWLLPDDAGKKRYFVPNSHLEPMNGLVRES